VNGEEVKSEVEPRMLLVDFIRERLGLTGTHIGCDSTICGACTIIVNGKTVKSCTMLVVEADGSEVLTIEGLSKEGMHPIQRALWENDGLQCGYCTPGIVMSALFLLKRHESPTDEQIREAIAGNLCRCTGYVSIIKSIKEAALRMSGSAG
jgi:carbon-monoxide dehydrogenase small subunit